MPPLKEHSKSYLIWSKIEDLEGNLKSSKLFVESIVQKDVQNYTQEDKKNAIWKEQPNSTSTSLGNPTQIYSGKVKMQGSHTGHRLS